MALNPLNAKFYFVEQNPDGPASYISWKEAPVVGQPLILQIEIVPGISTAIVGKNSCYSTTVKIVSVNVSEKPIGKKVEKKIEPETVRKEKTVQISDVGRFLDLEN